MLCFGLEKINRIFFLTSKLRNILRGILFIVSSLLNTLFLLFFEVYLVIALVAPILLHFNLEKHHLYCAFSFVTIVDLVYCLFWSFYAKYVHCTWFRCWQSPKTLLLPCRKNFNMYKRHGYLVCCLVFSKYVLSTVLWHFNLKMHPPYFSCCSLHFKYTKLTLFLCS